MEIPVWFGQFEYLIGIITIWFGIAAYILVGYFRVKDTKLNIKSKIISIKDWWAKRKELKNY